MLENISTLEEIREKLKIKLKCHLFRIKNNILPATICTLLLEYLPLFLKLEKLAYQTFLNSRWEKCFTREKENIDLYYQTLYNEELPSSTVEKCVKHRKRLNV
ncbi:hypothetical protein [Salinimicrobium marinum]|uniref:hypothetical protein n=1 Tax=Salinimicrobium marinum TaxID=680283 RepID=UPI001675A874|nr:hypothetical protein [Salinimicrobium marinum]